MFYKSNVFISVLKNTKWVSAVKQGHASQCLNRQTVLSALKDWKCMTMFEFTSFQAQSFSQVIRQGQHISPRWERHRRDCLCGEWSAGGSQIEPCVKC